MATRPHPATTRTPLDKASAERLSKLQKDWLLENTGGFFNTQEKLTLHDLHLLLEHFEPLRALIRSMARLEPPTASMPPVQPACAAPHPQLDSAADISAPPAAPPDEDALRTLAKQRNDALRQLEQLQQEQADLASRSQNTMADLKTCTARVQELHTDNQQLQQERDWLDEQLQQSRKEADKQRKAAQQAQKKLDNCQAELEFERSRPSAPPSPEVDILRRDTELAQRLDISPLPDDPQQALIRTVAVLSQRSNLERLWQALRERCNTQQRAAQSDELALLTSALAWHNHNWHARPYSLLEVAPGSRYDYESHQRCQHTATGEQIQAQLLPGLADGSGAPLCKPLVRTG